MRPSSLRLQHGSDRVGHGMVFRQDAQVAPRRDVERGLPGAHTGRHDDSQLLPSPSPLLLVPSSHSVTG